MQFTETYLSCFLFIAQRLVTVCICITRNKLDLSCKYDETYFRGFLFIAQRLVIVCICITRNKLDMSCKYDKTHFKTKDITRVLFHAFPFYCFDEKISLERSLYNAYTNL